MRNHKEPAHMTQLKKTSRSKADPRVKAFLAGWGFAMFVCYLPRSAFGQDKEQAKNQKPSETPQSDPKQNPAPFRDHRNQIFSEDMLRGKYTLISLFYSTCPTICGFTVTHLKQAEYVLKEKTKNYQVLLFTIDPEGDTPEALAKLAKERELSEHWKLITGPKTETARILHPYHLRFDQMNASELHRKHSNLMMLVGPDGKLITHTNSLKPDLGALIKDVKHDANEGRPSGPDRPHQR